MFKNKKIPYIEFLPLIVLSFILFKVIDNTGWLSGILSKVFTILNPFILAFVISYFVNPMMTWIEEKFKLKRIASLSISGVFIAGAVALFIGLLVPALVVNIKDLLTNAPGYITEIERWVREFSRDNYDIVSKISTLLKSNDGTDALMQKSTGFISAAINGVVLGTVQVTTIIVNFTMAIVISLYMLYDKENLLKKTDEISRIFLKAKTYENIKEFLEIADSMFRQFLTGKALTSAILGILCLIGLMIFKVPYAALIGLLVAVGNMIPYIGSLFSGSFAFIVSAFANPMMGVWVVVYIMILQNVDGWILVPKIIGDKVKLSALSIMFALTVGGTLMGIIGMFVCVPVIAILNVYVERYLEKKKLQNLES